MRELHPPFKKVSIYPDSYSSILHTKLCSRLIFVHNIQQQLNTLQKETQNKCVWLGTTLEWILGMDKQNWNRNWSSSNETQPYSHWTSLRNSRNARITAELLLPESVLLDEKVESLGLLPHVVKRNAFCHRSCVDLERKVICNLIIKNYWSNMIQHFMLYLRMTSELCKYWLKTAFKYQVQQCLDQNCRRKDGILLCVSGWGGNFSRTTEERVQNSDIPLQTTGASRLNNNIYISLFLIRSSATLL